MAPNRLCLITALAPVPASLGGSCPLGCSLNAPATGGCSVFSLQWSMYAAGSEKEKRAGCPLHGATIAQLFVFCKGGVGGALPGRKVLVWPAPSFSGGSGLASAVVPPAHPPTFWKQGDSPCTPRREPRVPCTLLGDGSAVSSPSPGAGAGTRCACWTDGLVVACAVLQRGDWLGVRRCPTGPPSNVFRNRGTPPVPPAGAAPPAPAGGTGFCFGLRPPSAGDWLGLRRCPTGPPSNVFGNRGTPPAPPGGALGSLHPPLRDR